MNKFWKWVRNRLPNPDNPAEEVEERTLMLNGTIAAESWFDDDVTPALFRSELNSGKGDITVWINSPGGDCFAAAEIYNMLRDYEGKVTIKIDGLAASAASVIAMAGDEVLVSPVSMMMIHNPATIAMGDHVEMQKAIDMLEEVKNSIINAYMVKTGMSRNKLSKLMDEETWMNAAKAVELHFADAVIERGLMDEKKSDEEDLDEGETDEEKQPEDAMTNGTVPEGGKNAAMLFSRRKVDQAITNKLEAYCKEHEVPEKPVENKLYRVEDCMKRLDLIKKLI